MIVLKVVEAGDSINTWTRTKKIPIQIIYLTLMCITLPPVNLLVKTSLT